MPHIWLKNPNIDLIKTEKIKFCGKNSYGEYLIMLNFADLEFALLLKQKDGKWLLKYDKPSRPSNTKILKDATKFVSESLNCEILKDNTNGNKDFALDGLLESDSFNPKDFDSKEVFAEIGFGSGLHLENLAKQNSDKTYIGVEIYKPAIYKFLNRCSLNGIKNAYAIDEDARNFFEALPVEFLNGLYVHFPVPWPDAPHRRVWSKEFLQKAVSVVKQNGFVHLRTDDKDYFEFAKEVADELGLSYEFAKNEPLAVISKYEARWHRQNKDIYDLVVIKKTKAESENKEYNFDLGSFELTPTTVVKDGILLTIKEPYIAVNGDKIFKVALGATNRPKMYYLLSNSDGLSYYPKKPLFTESNIKAHNLLLDIKN